METIYCDILCCDCAICCEIGNTKCNMSHNILLDHMLLLHYMQFIVVKCCEIGNTKCNMSHNILLDHMEYIAMLLCEIGNTNCGMICSILLHPMQYVIVKRCEIGHTNCIMLHKILLHHVHYVVLYRCNKLYNIYRIYYILCNILLHYMQFITLQGGEIRVLAGSVSRN